MKILTGLLPLLLLPSLLLAGPSPAEPSPKSNIIEKLSPFTVEQTMDNFEAIIKKKSLVIFARINHKKNAESVNMDMSNAQVLVFGNPNAGTLIMKQDIRAALDLPMRVAVYKSSDGKVYIAYHSPLTMVNNYELNGNKAIAKITKGLDALTSAAITDK